MKQHLTNRYEIAKALNFGKYPVVFANLDDCKTEYGWDLGRIKIDLGELDEQLHGYRFEYANLYIYKDELRLTTASAPVILSNSFNVEDIKEMSVNANAPTLKVNEKLALVLAKGRLAVTMLISPKRFTKFCQAPLSFEDDDMKSDFEYLGVI